MPPDGYLLLRVELQEALQRLVQGQVQGQRVQMIHLLIDHVVA